MAGRRKRFPNITDKEAHAALRWLVTTGEVTAKQITEALKRRERLAVEIRARLEQLGGEGLRFLRGPGNQRRVPAKHRRASAAAMKAWRLQGAYMGSVRRLSKADRGRVKRIREKSGVRAAIAAAKRLGKG